jgi:ATP-binding cassette subfamily A (ABC1) protein 3
MINNCDVLSPESFEHFRQMIGVCPQHDILFDDLTVEEHSELFYDFKTYDRKDATEEINKILKDIGLEDKRTTRASNLSGGQKRKLSIGLAIVGKSSIIFLDEPTSGMDITSRRNLWDILKKIVSNKIVILTTHFMEEAQILGDKIGILSQGIMQVVGTPLELIDRYTNCVNLNITKHSDADENEIIAKILPKFGELDIYFENFNKDIYFRIPTNHPTIKMVWDQFF